MNIKLFLLFVAAIVTMSLFGQTETLHFKYEKVKGGGTLITPKGEINKALAKGYAYLGHREPPYQQIDVARAKPFQELIDKGVFSNIRMKELEHEEQIVIYVTFDETGIISYVCFYIPSEKKSLLTDNELYRLCQIYKGVKYFDMSKSFVSKSKTGSKTSFYCQDGFDIPFSNLKY